MKLNIKLSEGSINQAIRRLEEVNEQLQQGTSDLVDILVTEGAEIANADYGGMATAWGKRDNETNGMVTGHIGVTGEDEATVYIAEFGAGDATMPVLFENYPGVDVYPGAYSEQVGTKEYATTGRWHYGGATFTEVQPRAGLLDAKYFIQNDGIDIAKEVLDL